MVRLAGNYLLGEGIQQTYALLDYPNPPTAIITGNDDQATDVYQALYRRNIRIPDDMSVSRRKVLYCIIPFVSLKEGFTTGILG